MISEGSAGGRESNQRASLSLPLNGEAPTPEGRRSSISPERDRVESAAYRGCRRCGAVCEAGGVPIETTSLEESADAVSCARARHFDELHQIRDLINERSNLDIKSNIQQAWAKDLQIASIYYDSDDYSLSTVSKVDADLWCLDSQRFNQYALDGVCFDRPVLVRKAVRDAGWHSVTTTLATLERKLDGQSVQVRNPLTHEIESMDGDDFLAAFHDSRAALNALDLPAFIRGDRPEFTLLSRYRLLEDLVRTEAWDYATKQRPIRELDLIGCTQFNLASLRGSFSGAHLNSLNGTWVRNFVGRKAWMFVPPAQLTDGDLERLARDGDNWRPRGKARTIVLHPDDVFFMPPGCNVVHAVLTLDASVMEGAMLWDENTITRILNNMLWIANNQRVTNEPWPNNIQAILTRLDQAVFADPDRFWGPDAPATSLEAYESASMGIRSLACSCARRCASHCPCRLAERQCTVECRGHGGRRLACMRDGIS